MFRVGFGQDSHRFSKDENKKLILGGVEVRGYRGLESNSDGDPISHALCAAIEQALGRTNFSVIIYIYVNNPVRKDSHKVSHKDSHKGNNSCNCFNLF